MPRWFVALLPTLVLLEAPRPAQDLRFAELRRSLPTDALPGVLTAGDVDGDGDLDLLAGNRIGLDRLWLNAGSGIFLDTPGLIPVNDDETRDVALGDLDGDGDLDAWIGLFESKDDVWLNGGAGDFTFAEDYDYSDTTAVELVDVDGDGDLDAVVGEASQSKVNVHLNDGLAGFGAQGSTPNLFTGEVTDLASGDLDGDGDADLLVARSRPLVWAGNPEENALLLNQGGGTFTDGSAALLGLVHQTHAVALHDLDLDGDLDVLLGENDVDHLLLNDGAGGFVDASANLPQVPTMSRALGVADLEGDGDPDVVIGRGWTWATAVIEPLGLWRNDGTAVFSDDPGALGSDLLRVNRVILADVDGDLDPDILLASETQDRLLRNDGSGAFTDTTQDLINEDMSSRDVEVADFDGDGNLDALVCTAYNTSIPTAEERLYLGDGRGGFVLDVTGLPPGSGAYNLDAGDVDGDGDADVLLAGGGNPNRLWLRTGPTTFADASGQLPSLTAQQDFALVDVDGDGDLDALGASNVSSLVLNDGTGQFSDGSAGLPPTPPAGVAVETGDLDGDGDDDAVFVGSWPFQDRIFLNDGLGGFTDVAPLPTAATQAVALGDYDLDGDLDALAGGFSYAFDGSLASSAIVSTQNDGGAGFAGATYLGAGIVTRIHAHDLDQDGDLDAWVSVGLGPDRILENDGTGAFPASLGTTVQEPSGAVGFGDFDGDGDLDAFAASPGGSDRVYLNLERQLAVRTVPAIGKPLTFELHGPAGGPWLLAASLAEASIATPFGTLGLAPGAVQLQQVGSLDGAGEALPSFPVPALTQLVGGTVYWQALLGPPARLTQVETIVLTDL